MTFLRLGRRALGGAPGLLRGVVGGREGRVLEDVPVRRVPEVGDDEEDVLGEEEVGDLEVAVEGAVGGRVRRGEDRGNGCRRGRRCS